MVLKRFGVSIPEDLLEEFDQLVMEKGYIGRSEAIRDAMRVYISESQWEKGGDLIMASLNIVYCHKPKTMADLIKIQHASDAHVISTVHVHMSQSHCLEVITLKGSKESITKLANKITGITGIEYAKLFTFALPEDAEMNHSHRH
ncbi:nickel-responsive transcriptional regulator NikR [Candidatus Thorarchaeota archaeon]|jgi:CopG family nickel-responsive transcriptional regulator|nr:MAG: nickel-responsive transcriptional regulator NikR [Candidatus Thorarchaeota archaeon]